MIGSTLVELLEVLPVGASWTVLVLGVSSLYWMTIRRFDHVDLLQERERFLLESRGRRRL